jgi:2-polyprenyl-6-methoxyphenol hydroxylase-like FAD-dependent oxidoreductase
VVQSGDAGAGPAGAAALLLARCDTDVAVVERETSLEYVFRGEGLMPLGIDALFKMRLGGVLEVAAGKRPTGSGRM